MPLNRAIRGSAWSLGCGLAVLAAAWLGPLPDLSRHSFGAHMLMHMSVVAVAAPLIAAGLAGRRFDPVRAATGAVGAVAFSPLLASLLEFVVVWAWHLPALHHAARHDGGWLVAEQGGFLGVGMLVWLSALGGREERFRARAAAGIGGLLLTSMHMTLLGVLLALAERPLYAHAAPARIAFGLTPLQDQHLGGVVMLSFGGVAYLAGALALLAMLLHDRRREAFDG